MVVSRPCTALVHIAKQRWSLQASIFIFLSPPSPPPYPLSLRRKGDTVRGIYTLFIIFKTTENKKASLSLSASGPVREPAGPRLVWIVLDFSCSLLLSNAWLGFLLVLTKMGMWAIFGEIAFWEAEQLLPLPRTAIPKRTNAQRFNITACEKESRIIQ